MISSCSRSCSGARRSYACPGVAKVSPASLREKTTRQGLHDVHRPRGWAVRFETSSQRPCRFASWKRTLEYVRLLAKAKRRGLLQLVAQDGAITRQWSYITFDSLYA
jgi:hypothetical protein